jgi:hypothetical protein
MLKLSSKLEANYSSCTVRSSENIYVTAVEVLRKKERQGETQKSTTKIDGFLSFIEG